MKLFSNLLVITVLVIFSSCKKEVREVKIIPEPASIVINKGTYTIPINRPIYVQIGDADLELAGRYLAERFEKSSELKPKLENVTEAPGKGIFLAIGKLDFTDNPEGYELRITDDEIRIIGSSARGVFWGVQSFLQLLPPAVYGDTVLLKSKDLVVPQVLIQDEPRFKWRGMHLDVGRHLFPVEFIKKYIDLLAMHKLNVFHWHLTEDQGWRIEIKKYPRLTEVGSIRTSADGSSYGGFYTQEEVKEVVAYARSRFVDVMPEIEMPGHSVAALAAYPELSCTGGPFKVRTAWGVSQDVYCAGKETTFNFIENVLSEVVDLFPFEYVHIGGDECPKTRWENCPDCQARIRKEGLKNEHELQSYFIQRIEKFLKTKNRRMVGWDEILEGGLAPEATVMSWRGISGGIAAARQFHDVIMSPTSHCYFDFYQGDPRFEPKAIGGYLPMEKVYSYEPVPTELNDDEAKHILGAQANVWTEYIADPSYVEYMALPRMCALAEVVWTPKEFRDYEKFLYRMDRQYQRLDAMKMNYRVPPPVVPGDQMVFVDRMEVELKTPVDQAEIRFTTDGTDPGSGSILYGSPIPVEKTSTIKAVTVMPSGHASQVVTIQLEKQVPVAGYDLGNPANGLSVDWFDGNFSSVDQLNDLKNNRHYETALFSLPDPLPEGAYGMIMEGYVRIDSVGVYCFTCTSDDGSVLSINDKSVVQNDGLHAPMKRSGEIALGKGWQRIRVAYIQAGGGQVFEVSWSGPGIENQPIPADRLAPMSTMMKMR